MSSTSSSSSSGADKGTDCDGIKAPSTSAVCIECGSVNDGIKAEDSKLRPCVYCKRVIDKYVEYEFLVVLIDLLLFHPR